MNFDPGVTTAASAGNSVTLEKQTAGVAIGPSGNDLFGPGTTPGLTDAELDQLG